MRKILLIAALTVLLLSCKKNKPAPSSEKSINSFVLKAALNPVLSSDFQGVIISDSIIVSIPRNTALNHLVPSIAYTGTSVNPADGKEQDFTNAKTYTVTAADKSTRTYTVVVRWMSNEKAIISFGFKALSNTGLSGDATGIISGDTIRVNVDAGDVTSLVPEVVYKGASLSPTPAVPKNFTSPVEYTVYAEDGSFRKYTVLVFSNTIVFVGGRDGYVYALDGISGLVKWKYNLGNPVITSPTYASGIVYVTNGSKLFAFDAVSGQLNWQTSLGGNATTSPHLVDGIVYSVTSKLPYNAAGTLTAVNATTGAIKWEQQFMTDVAVCNPTVVNGILVTADFGYGLRAYNAATGMPIWAYDAGIIRDNPVIVNGVVYVGSEFARMLALDVAGGKQIAGWQPTGPQKMGVGSSPTYFNGVVYNGGDSLYAYDAATGYIKWRAAPGLYGVYNPVVSNNIIYATQQGDFVYAFNLDGSLKWKHGTIGNTNYSVGIASATVANGLVYYGTGIDNKFTALNALTGDAVWIFQGTAPFTSGPCVTDSHGNVFHSAVSGAQQ